jgi:serine/threonine protein kinase
MRGMIAGTITYVAPEQIRGDELGPSADVYSLAVLAYQLLLGEPPFASKSDLELLRMHLRSTPPAPAVLWRSMPEPLAAILVAMLAKDPADRPPVTEVRRVMELALAELRATPQPGLVERNVGGWLAQVGAGLAGLA